MLVRIPDDLAPVATKALQLERARSLTACTNENATSATTSIYDLCPPSKYRLPTGECNNVSHRKWGARGDIFLRLLAADYADGISKPRSSRGTHALPEAEYIIEQLQKHVEPDQRHAHITAMLPAWGQLLANDLIEVSEMPLKGKCCSSAAQRNPAEVEQCYVRLGAGCREYRRSAPGYDSEMCTKRKFVATYRYFDVKRLSN